MSLYNVPSAWNSVLAHFCLTDELWLWYLLSSTS